MNLNHVVRLGFAAATPFAPQARLRIAQPAKKFTVGRDAVVVPLKQNTTTWVELIQVD